MADVAGAMWNYGLFNRNSVAFILGRATPLIFAGLAVAIAFKAGLFNIGVEGQYAIGALTAGYVGYQLSAPTVIHLPLTILAGMAGGMLWAAIPALLKVYRGAHEVISTIMMNFVANAILLYLLSGALKDPNQQGSIAQQQTPPIKPSAQVGSMVPFFNSIGFDFRGSAPVTWFFVLAIVAAVLYALTVRRTRFGFELRVLGTNPRAAEPSGIRSNAMIMKAMLLSGAIAGLVALQDVIGIDDRMKLDYIRGYGFTGIAIALLGRNSGLGIVAAALLFSFLDRASSGIGLNTERAQGGHDHHAGRDHPHHRDRLRAGAPHDRPPPAPGAARTCLRSSSSCSGWPPSPRPSGRSCPCTWPPWAGCSTSARASSTSASTA